MPAQDVTDAFDADLLDTFTLVRRVETISSKGRPVLTPTNTANQFGVIAMAAPNDLERLPEADRVTKSIVIVTRTRLQLASPIDANSTNKADEVIWAGDTYQVRLVEDYSRFGQGYIWALAQATAYLPAAPTPAP